MGRFASPDTIVPDPGNPQSFNRYSYALNNPIRYTDPTGHDVCPADLSAVECSSGTNVAYITAQPTTNFAATIAHIPIDATVAKLVPVLCTTSGCHFLPSLVPTYVDSAGYMPLARSEQQLQTGKAIDAAAASLDLQATGVSGSFVATQIIAAFVGGPFGPDDGVIAAAYSSADDIENAYSKMAAGLVILGDFLSGESDLGTSGVVIGQDSMVAGITALIGEAAGVPPVSGPALDTIVNLAVNVYDVGRLSGEIPNVFETRFDSSGPSVWIYP